MFQLGFVVPDLMAAAANWVRVFGVGPFHIMPRVQNTCRYRGADATVDIHIGVAQAGPVQIELIQDYTQGPSVFRDMATLYGTNGFGFHQASTLTRNYDAKVAHYLDISTNWRASSPLPVSAWRSSTPLRTSDSSLRSSRRSPASRRTWPESPRPVRSGTAPIPSVSSAATATELPTISESNDGQCVRSHWSGCTRNRWRHGNRYPRRQGRRPLRFCEGSLQMFTTVTAAEWGRYGIRANCIAVGAIASERVIRAWQVAGIDKAESRRRSRWDDRGPDEVAAWAILFVTSLTAKAASFFSRRVDVKGQSSP